MLIGGRYGKSKNRYDRGKDPSAADTLCAVRILWINTVFVWIRHPLTIFFAYGASWTITFIVQAILYRRLQKKIGAQWEAEKLAPKPAELAEANT